MKPADDAHRACVDRGNRAVVYVGDVDDLTPIVNGETFGRRSSCNAGEVSAGVHSRERSHSVGIAVGNEDGVAGWIDSDFVTKYDAIDASDAPRRERRQRQSRSLRVGDRDSSQRVDGNVAGRTARCEHAEHGKISGIVKDDAVIVRRDDEKRTVDGRRHADAHGGGGETGGIPGNEQRAAGRRLLRNLVEAAGQEPAGPKQRRLIRR